jgi:homoserine O-acetyltransferase
MSENNLVRGEEGVFAAGDFVFESGAKMAGLLVGYVTHGRLNAARDNAVLLVPGTGNTRHSADGYIGQGNALDPTRHFIIAVDAIGAGTSSKPEDGLGGAFPRYGIRDMVRAEHALVESFGVRRLKAVMGASMGAFQALEWTIQFPEAAARAVLLVPAARAGNVFRSVVRAMIEVIELDPAWNGGLYAAQPLAGLRAAGRIYYPWTVSDAYLESLTPHALEAELAGSVERAVAWDAWNLIRRYEASAGHDVSVPFGGDLTAALSQVRAALLVMPASTDRLLGIDNAREIAKWVRTAHYAEVPTARGHLGWRAVEGAPETLFIAERIARFLDDR